jgi:hypothetical protein
LSRLAQTDVNDGIANYVAPDNVIIVSADEPAPPGADQVVFYSLESERDRSTSNDG